MEHRQRKPAIGCVSFLNARPLIDGVDQRDDLTVRFDVPSGLLSDLNNGEVNIALCPVIDYQRSEQPLVVVPVGGIGCAGPTLTVRLFSRIQLQQVAQVHADTDSHTSVALMRIILGERYGHLVDVVDHAPAHLESPLDDWPETLLLIGDKVVTRQPPEAVFPHQMDLGEAWHDMTGLPFVFAVWMAPANTDLGPLPGMLDEARRTNAARIDQIVNQYAAKTGWPDDLARHYLGHLLRYDIGPEQLKAIEHFWALADQHDLIHRPRPLQLYVPSSHTG